MINVIQLDGMSVFCYIGTDECFGAASVGPRCVIEEDYSMGGFNMNVSIARMAHESAGEALSS